MTRRSRAALPALLLVLAWSAAPARATMVLARSFHELCAEAEVIFVGTVSSVDSRWADPERQAIETLVTFSVNEAILGELGDEVSLRFAGGRIGDRRSEVVGLPTFETGDRVVVLARDGRAVSPIVGFHQGLFRIRGTGEASVVVAADGRSPVKFDAVAPGAGSGGQAAAAPLGLERFVDMIRGELAAFPGPR